MEYSKKTDKKWQEKWKEKQVYKFNKESQKQKLYTLEMFSYPSGAKLHLGHWFNYAPADSYARFKKMQGYNVFHPMGFDAFGLPAENYAIKTGIHPEQSTLKNIETMKKQLEEMGGSYDWDYSVQTCMPDYYKWTQWIFTKLYEAGLAYKKEAPVNWCDSCKTVLANEQVIGGKCERCGSEVKRKKLAQWFFKITNYAEELLQDLDKLDWPESTKKVQTNWIGKSEGSEVIFKSEDDSFDITVFTTRADTLNGVTYVVIAPESELVQRITTKDNIENVEKYIAETAKLSEIERLSTEKEKTGVFTGAYVINPINNEKIPVWIADYVLEDYGTGAVMAVPAHDTRDYEFATKYNLPIKEVVKSAKEEKEELPFTDYGILFNSGKYDGMTSKEAKSKITEDLSERNQGNKTINYRLKDWLISRQRYWGAPIPIIYCDKCGTVAVPEEDLPVLLPKNVEFKPDGESPLKKSEEFMIISEQGEDKILYDDKIGIGINTEVLEKENYKEYLKEEYGIDDISTFKEIRTTELGHIFQLGTRYSEIMNGKYTDKDGKEALYYMGCYGIGVSRTLAALYEHCLINDSKWGPCGFSLPEEIAPYKIQIVPKMDNEEKVKQGNELYQLLNKEGIGCILDDRENLNIGAKIKDCKVLGTPYLVVLGDKAKENEFEIESIKTGEKEIYTLEELIKRFK